VLLRIGQISGDALAIEQGALYPALYRLEGFLASEGGPRITGGPSLPAYASRT